MSEGFDSGFGGDFDAVPDQGGEEEGAADGLGDFADLDSEPDVPVGAGNFADLDDATDAHDGDATDGHDGDADATAPPFAAPADQVNMQADAADGQYDMRGDFAPEAGDNAHGGDVSGRPDGDFPEVITSDEGNLFVRWGDTYYEVTGGEVIEILEPSDDEVDTAPTSYLSTIKQSLDLVRLAAARIKYAISADQTRQSIQQLRATKAVTPEQVEERAVAGRRALERQTRANLPGDFAEGLNKIAAVRNQSRYGDHLGWRDPGHLRSERPQATTESIVSGSGRTHRGATATGVAGGVVGSIFAFVGALGLGEDINNKIEGGRVQVNLQDLRPDDFPVGYEIKHVDLGFEDGYFVVGTIRVERNVIGKKKFYVVRAGRAI